MQQCEYAFLGRDVSWASQSLVQSPMLLSMWSALPICPSVRVSPSRNKAADRWPNWSGNIRGRGLQCEEVIQIVTQEVNTMIVSQGPFHHISNRGENKRRWTQAKRKSHAKIISTLALHTQQIQIRQRNRSIPMDITTRCCHIKLSHQIAFTSNHDTVNELVDSYILHWIGVLRYAKSEPVSWRGAKT